MTTDAHHVKAVIVERRDHVIVEVVGVSLDQPDFGDAERLTTHVAQQALSSLDVYLHDRRQIILQQPIDLRRMEQGVSDDRHTIIIATDCDQVAQVHINRDHAGCTKPQPMIDRGNVRLLMPHPKVASTKIQHGDARAVDVAPMIDGRFAADPIVQVWRVKVHGSLNSLRLA